MDLIANLNDAKTIERIQYEESFRRLETIFEQIGYNSDITFQQFEKIVKSKNPFFVERMFKIFDKDGSNTVSKDEFMSTVRSIVGKPPEEKLKWIFEIYDIDGDGTITHDELMNVLRSCMFENGLTFTDEQIDVLTTILLSDADTDRTGTITYEKLSAQLSRHPGLIENISMSVERWLLPPPPPQPIVKKSWFFHKLQWTYIRNNSTSVIFLTLFIIINIILFITRAIDYKSFGVFLMLARANGQCLNFTCSFILALMLRRSITYLRSHGYAVYLPLDHHVYYHKLTGWFICGFSIFHTISHVLNNAQNADKETQSLILSNFAGTALLTGWLLLVILATMMIPAQSFMRSAGKFELFYYSHLFYVGFFVVLFFHAPNFWKWFLAPGFIFIIEALQRFRSSFGSDIGATYIEKGIILPSRVIHLVIKRPTNFDYHPGDYVFVRIPAVAKYEWHPFTISSAPEQEGEIWLHIRAVGEWTNRLLDFFVYQEKLSSQVKGCLNEGFDQTFQIKSTNKCDKQLSQINAKSCQNEYSRNVSSVVSFDQNISRTLTAKEDNPIKIDRKFGRLRKISAPIFGNKLVRDPIDRRASDAVVTAKPSQGFRRPSILILPIPEDYQSFDEESLPYDIECPKTSRTSSISNFPFKSFEGGNEIHLVTPLKVHIDGPYGSPSSHIFRTQHAVMIATGIGVTPFASILQSIMQKHIKSKQNCPNCCYSWYNHISSNVMKLRKVDFVWINRDQKSFEWFVELLSELEIQQAELGDKDRFLDIHMYITSALDKSDIKAIGLQLALDLMHEKARRDLITGLKTRTQPGRPKWNTFFEEISRQKKGRVTVFFCGPSELGRSLHQSCNKFGFQFCKEIF